MHKAIKDAILTAQYLGVTMSQQREDLRYLRIEFPTETVRDEFLDLMTGTPDATLFEDGDDAAIVQVAS